VFDAGGVGCGRLELAGGGPSCSHSSSGDVDSVEFELSGPVLSVENIHGLPSVTALHVVPSGHTNS
jgi:hypothetical protein